MFVCLCCLHAINAELTPSPGVIACQKQGPFLTAPTSV
jgi:hypothetical protein